jgi:hypothetical protein
MRGRTELLPVPCAFLDLNVLLVKDVCLRVLVHLHKKSTLENEEEGYEKYRL